MQKLVLSILVLTTFLSSCRKENISNDCGNLKDGIATNDISKVEKAITNIITGLQSKDYNETNINALSQRMSSNCDVKVESTCFDCIKTLPSQTEIRLSVNSAGALNVKTIDLSYTPAN